MTVESDSKLKGGVAMNVAIAVVSVLLVLALGLLLAYQRHSASSPPCIEKQTLSGATVCCPVGASCD